MKLDFHRPRGNVATPLIRLYGPDVEPLRELHCATEMLSQREGLNIQVDAIRGVEPINGCKFALSSVSIRHRSIITQQGNAPNFIGQATCEDWITAHELLDPLLHGGLGFQWLFGGDARGLLSSSNIAFLVSTYADAHE